MQSTDFRLNTIHCMQDSNFQGKRNKGRPRPRLRWIGIIKEDIISHEQTLRGTMDLNDVGRDGALVESIT